MALQWGLGGHHLERQRLHPNPRGAGGLLLVVKEEFLQNFEHHNFFTVLQGRAACLQLEGKKGCLDLWSVYAQTGQGAQRDRTCSGKMSHLFRDQQEHLSILAGDFNFV